MRFLTGIIDSEDISLNISREMLQNDPVITKIRNNIVKKVISQLEKELKNNKEGYSKFWENFGTVFKEGIHEDFTNKDLVLKLSMFESSQVEGWITLDEYVTRMSKEQKDIYGETFSTTTRVEKILNDEVRLLRSIEIETAKIPEPKEVIDVENEPQSLESKLDKAKKNKIKSDDDQIIMD